MDISEDNHLLHFGILRRSGRYPWGSGNDPYQNSVGFQKFMDECKAKGMSQTDVAKYLSEYSGEKISTTDLRANVTIATEQIRAQNVAMANTLAAKRVSNRKIAERMGLGVKGESTVRGWLKSGNEIKANSVRATAESLKQELETKPFLDVGKGTHLYKGVSFTKFNTALSMLKDEGYNVHPFRLPQLGTGKMTPYKVLTKGNVSWHEARDAVKRGELRVVASQSDDGGLTYRTPKAEPVSVNSKRIQVRYKEDGGETMDGVLEIRRGVEDLSLGKNRYAQVRVAVDGTHYLKGMAMYADDLPAGVDIRFNTSKSNMTSGGKVGVMKPLKIDKTSGKIDAANPFGAQTRPHVYIGKDGKEHTSPLNLVNEEGSWDKWANNLSSQFTSKQSLALATTQLGKARASRQKDLDEIMSLTNPVVKKKLLEEFAETADAAAVHLKAAALDRQATRVILPMNSMRPNEIYAPGFNNGERVVLVRHPHGGPFEIPELTVNNKNLTARRILSSNPRDAVGIHHSVAKQLSGADFDGDTVLVIPNDSRKVKTARPLKGLEDFDPQIYKIPDGDTTTPRMSKRNTQTEMGKISNLITDMTIHKAAPDEIARAVRHSMVVIDAEKHDLNYKESELRNGIRQLKEKYQGSPRGGASTIISRAGAEARVPQFKERGIDSKTGARIQLPTGKVKIGKDGQPIINRKTGEPELRTQKTTKMEATNDARTLLSKNPQPMEELYASYANTMKTMANEARLASIRIPNPNQSAPAKVVYANEIKSLESKLQVALRNAPLERRAQTLAEAWAKARIDSDPTLDKDDIKKINNISLQEARDLTGASKIRIGSEHSPLTHREWEAIQAGAISATKLREILNNADMDVIKKLATPRPTSSLTPGQIALARSLEASGKTRTEIAERLGIPRSTLTDNLDKT